MAYRFNKNGEAILCGAEIWPEALIISDTRDGHTAVEIGDNAFDTDNAADSSRLGDGPIPAARPSATFMDIMIEEMV